MFECGWRRIWIEFLEDVFSNSFDLRLDGVKGDVHAENAGIQTGNLAEFEWVVEQFAVWIVEDPNEVIGRQGRSGFRR